MTHQTSRSVWFSAGAALLAAATLAGQAPQSDPAASPPARPAEAAGTAVVRGRVLAADTGLPLRRAKVTLRNPSDRRGRATLTDAAGAFVFQAVPAGRYRLRASKSRFVDTWLGARRPGGPGRAFEVADGQKLGDLTVALAAAGAITGRVVDEDGEPIARAMVSALQRKALDGDMRLTSVGSAVTDDTGSYRVFGLAPGRYHLSAQPNPDEDRDALEPAAVGLAQTYYPSTPVGSEAQPIDVLAGAEAIADVTVVAIRIAPVSGVVVDAAGRPAIGGLVHLEAADGGTEEPGRRFDTLRPDGTFTLAGVPPGDYTLTARAFFDEDELMRLAMTGALDDMGFTQPLVVSGAAVEGLRVVVPPPLEVPGRVVLDGAPPPGSIARIFASLSRGRVQTDQGTLAGPDGRFTLRLRPGTWRFSAWTPKGWMVKRIGYRDAVVVPGDPVEVTAEPGGSLDVVLTSQLTAIEGSVADASGAPVMDYHAVVFPAERVEPRHDAGYRTRVEPADARGRFRFEGLPTGEYRVAAVADLDANEILADDTMDTLRASATLVRVRDGQTETVALKLAPPLP